MVKCFRLSSHTCFCILTTILCVMMPFDCPLLRFCVVRTSCFVPAETVVAESVVVIKKLLQTQPSQHSEIIRHMAKIFDNITVRFVVVLIFTVDPLVFVQCESKDKLRSIITVFCHPGSHGSSQHPVADGRVLREGAKDCA